MKIKMKNSKSFKKRFSINKNKIVKYKHSNIKHLLLKKTKKRKRHLKKMSICYGKIYKKIYKYISN